MSKKLNAFENMFKHFDGAVLFTMTKEITSVISSREKSMVKLKLQKFKRKRNSKTKFGLKPILGIWTSL